MDGIEVEKTVEELAEGPPPNRFNQLVAATVAVVAVFMALCNVKDNNIVQAMLAAQSREVDLWNQYQAKGIKQSLYERQIENWQLLSESSSAKSQVSIQKKIESWTKETQRYSEEKKEIKAQAEAAHREYDELNFRDDQFDFSDALLGLSIALFAVTSLVQSRPLFGFACLIALGGFVMGIAAFAGWALHPGIIKFLT